MDEKYYVESNYGGSVFEHETDAIQAFLLLADYHNLFVLQEQVKARLDTAGRYESFPLAITKVAG